MLMNQQYILNKVSLNKSTNKVIYWSVNKNVATWFLPRCFCLGFLQKPYILPRSSVFTNVGSKFIKHNYCKKSWLHMCMYVYKIAPHIYIIRKY